MADLTFLIIIAAVAAGLLLLQTNSGLVLLALCAGSVLVQFANKHMAYVNGHIDNKLLPHRFTVSNSTVLIVILLAPAVIVAFLQRHNFGISKWPLQVLPAIATGVLATLLVVPLLPNSIQGQVVSNHYWGIAEQNQVALVFICVIVALASAALSKRIGHKSKHH